MKDKSSKTLAAIVVSYRALGTNKEAAITAMEELVQRKAAGDEFDYEAWIKDKLKEVPTVKTEQRSAMALAFQMLAGGRINAGRDKS
jgi:hypothetical protein